MSIEISNLYMLVDWEGFEIEESDVVYLLSALRGEVPYDSEDVRIYKMESYVWCWLMDAYVPNKYEVLTWLYAYGIEVFPEPYGGYRGILLDRNRSLRYGYYTSFTSIGWVAEEFAYGEDEKYKSYVFASPEKMFNFSRMIRQMEGLTGHVGLSESIEEYRFEGELIGYFDENCEDVTHEFAFEDD